MDIEAIERRLAEIYRRRKWILTGDAAAGATQMVEKLKERDVAGIMIVAAIEGVGDIPEVDRVHYTRAHGDTIMRGVRAYVHSIDNPSADLLSAVDEFDPDGTALVLNPGFSRSTALFGRETYGSTRPEWRALEDKMLADELWDAAGVVRAPSEIVRVAEALTVTERLASELGSVWVADNTEGWHGGGEYLRWIQTDEDAHQAIEWFDRHAERVRIMPFLDGIPTSIHGFITRDGIAVFNPVEMTILRHVDRPSLFYANGGNFWNPPEHVRLEMRAAARSVGEVLSLRHGYLGGFGVDGICTTEGFRPTELNPRLSMGHAVHSVAAGIPIGGMERSMIAGDLDVDAADLEATILAASATHRRGGAMIPLDGSYPEAKTGFIVEADQAIAVDSEEQNDGTMTLGEAAFGSTIFAQFDSDRTPIGPSIAPRVLAILDLARELWGVEAPDLEAAPDLCA